MAVYVGPSHYPHSRMIMCHMVADTLPELHAMADRISVKRNWFQVGSRGRHPHYDICKAKRQMAVRFGAISVGEKEILRVSARSALYG